MFREYVSRNVLNEFFMLILISIDIVTVVFRNIFSSATFSAAKAALGMQMSVSLSVIQSVNNTYLFVRFTSIFYKSKLYRNET